MWVNIFKIFLGMAGTAIISSMVAVGIVSPSNSNKKVFNTPNYSSSKPADDSGDYGLTPKPTLTPTSTPRVIYKYIPPSVVTSSPLASVVSAPQVNIVPIVTPSPFEFNKATEDKINYLISRTPSPVPTQTPFTPYPTSTPLVYCNLLYGKYYYCELHASDPQCINQDWGPKYSCPDNLHPTGTNTDGCICVP